MCNFCFYILFKNIFILFLNTFYYFNILIYIKNHSNIFLSPDPLQSFHNNGVHTLTNNWAHAFTLQRSNRLLLPKSSKSRDIHYYFLLQLHYCFSSNCSSLCANTVTISSTLYHSLFPVNYFLRPYTLLLPVLSALFF